MKTTKNSNLKKKIAQTPEPTHKELVQQITDANRKFWSRRPPKSKALNSFSGPKLKYEFAPKPLSEDQLNEITEKAKIPTKNISFVSSSQDGQSPHTYNSNGFCKFCGWKKEFIKKTQRACLSEKERASKIDRSGLDQNTPEKEFCPLTIIKYLFFLAALFCTVVNTFNRGGDELFKTPIAFVFVGLSLVLYFLPSHIAYENKMKNATAIFVFNLLTGWTVIGWIISLVWSLARD